MVPYSTTATATQPEVTSQTVIHSFGDTATEVDPIDTPTMYWLPYKVYTPVGIAVGIEVGTPEGTELGKLVGV